MQASVQLLLAGVVGAFSGLLASSVGYEATFLVAGSLGLLALPIVYRTFSGR